MFANFYVDALAAQIKCVFGDEEAKAKGLEALPAACEKFMGFFERSLPEKGFYLGRDIPSLGDFAVHTCVALPALGFKGLKMNLDAYPKCLAVTASIDAML